MLASIRDFPAAFKDMPVGEWEAAVTARHSTRTYTGTPLEPESLDRLQLFCSDLPAPEVARVVLVREAPAEVFTGLVGGYGRVLGAPSALLIIGAEAAPTVQEAAGYLGEAAVLEAASLGLGTCWIAGFFDRGLAAALVPLAAGERVLAISPVGYAQAQPRAAEKMIKRLARAHKRRPLEEIAGGFDPAVWPAWAMSGVRLAQTAPSAGNRQPWRFELESAPSPASERPGNGEPAGAVVISAARGGYEGSVSRRLDCGIAMLHFEVGARLSGATGHWESLEAPGVARYRVAPTHDTRSGLADCPMGSEATGV